MTWRLGGRLWNGDFRTWGLGTLGTWGLGNLGTWDLGGLGFQFPLKTVSVWAKKSHGDFYGLRQHATCSWGPVPACGAPGPLALNNLDRISAVISDRFPPFTRVWPSGVFDLIDT